MREDVPESARVVVVAADPLARAGIAGLVAAADGLTLAAAVDGGERLSPAVDRHSPHLVLWDLGQAGAPDPAFDATLPTLVLTDVAAGARDALLKGAKGAIRRDLDGPRLALALRAVVAGLVVLDHPVETLSTRPKPAAQTAISPRELEVLELLVEGMSNKEIGASLEISEHTARFHVNALLDRLGARSRTEAAVLALREGLVRL